jgi:uncharacterized protein YhaN
MVAVDQALEPFTSVLRELEGRPSGSEHEDAVYRANEEISRHRWALHFALQEAARVLNGMSVTVVAADPKQPPRRTAAGPDPVASLHSIQTSATNMRAWNPERLADVADELRLADEALGEAIAYAQHLQEDAELEVQYQRQEKRELDAEAAGFDWADFF